MPRHNRLINMGFWGWKIVGLPGFLSSGKPGLKTLVSKQQMKVCLYFTLRATHRHFSRSYMSLRHVRQKSYITPHYIGNIHIYNCQESLSSHLTSICTDNIQHILNRLVLFTNLLYDLEETLY